jgi:sugar/nucleoside kinase (ribokinase family)
MARILVVGSVAFDTLHLAGREHTRVLGGSAVYASLAASHFTEVQLVGVVGHDFPESTLTMLRNRGIDLAGLEIADGETFHWEGRYSDDFSSRTTIRTDLNVFADYRPKIPDSFRRPSYVLLANIDPVLLLGVLKQLEKPRLTVADTMNLWIDTRRVELEKLLARVDLLVINDEEARQLSGEHNLVKAAGAARALGPRYVIIKKGEHGALLFGEEGIFSIPAWPLAEVQDPTGAGDTFAGAFLGYIARSDRVSTEVLRRALVYGSALASFCVEGVGVERLAEVSAEQIRDRFGEFHALTAFSQEA